jgi:hypothetical protein
MAKAAAEGIRDRPGGILAITTTVTIFIDIWASIFGYIWTNYIDKEPDKARPGRVPLPNLRLTNLGCAGAGNNEPRWNVIRQ